MKKMVRHYYVPVQCDSDFFPCAMAWFKTSWVSLAFSKLESIKFGWEKCSNISSSVAVTSSFTDWLLIFIALKCSLRSIITGDKESTKAFSKSGCFSVAELTSRTSNPIHLPFLHVQASRTKVRVDITISIRDSAMTGMGMSVHTQAYQDLNSETNTDLQSSLTQK